MDLSQMKIIASWSPELLALLVLMCVLLKYFELQQNLLALSWESNSLSLPLNPFNVQPPVKTLKIRKL